MNDSILPGLVRRYADAIMIAIEADMDAGIVPRSVSTFTELHDYVDANEYAVQAGVPWGSDPEALRYGDDGYALVNAVEGAVSAMLAVSVQQTAQSAAQGKLPELPADAGLALALTFEVVASCHPMAQDWSTGAASQ
jgi:hypothetical protein